MNEQSTPHTKLTVTHQGRWAPVADGSLLVATATAIALVRHGTVWPTYPVGLYLVSFAVFATLLVSCYYLAGVYEDTPRLGAPPVTPRVVSATASGVAVWALLQLALATLISPELAATRRVLPMPVGNLAALTLLAVMVIPARHQLMVAVRNRKAGPSRVLLVGPAEQVEDATENLESTSDAHVVGATGDPDQIIELAHRHQVTDVLLLDGIELEACYPHPIDGLHARQVGVLRQITAVHSLLGLQRIRQVGGMPFVLVRTQAVSRPRLQLKRLVDLAVLTVSAPVWVLLLVATAAYTRIVAGGPVIYRQDRVGHRGKTFTVLKFRTMGLDAEADGISQLATTNDPRVVRGCHWLRATRADELPQLLNIVRGDMSLVGPRPERPDVVAELARTIPGYDQRHDIPPGLTGLAQVYGRYHTSATYKLGYDLQYLVLWSVWLDLIVLARTIWVVGSRRM